MDQQQQSRGPTRRQLLWAGATVGLLTIAILIGYRYDIMLWDWIKLLVVPAIIAGVGLWFNRQQQERQQEAETRRTQDGVLQVYLDQMGQLLLDRDTPLTQSKKGDAVSTLARALTLTALAQLDGRRKGTLIQFLSEARLIQGSPDMTWGGRGHPGWARSRPIIELTSADLSDIDLSDAVLDYVILSEANLSGANLRGADLSNALMFDTDLTNADLFNATLPPRVLNNRKYLEGAIMPNGQRYEDWLKDREGRKEDAKND